MLAPTTHKQVSSFNRNKKNEVKARFPKQIKGDC
jgi:hypothetical protein